MMPNIETHNQYLNTLIDGTTPELSNCRPFATSGRLSRQFSVEYIISIPMR